MEALVAATHAALTIYDMLKGDRSRHDDRPDAPARQIGGASGDFVADAAPSAPASAEPLDASVATPRGSAA